MKKILVRVVIAVAALVVVALLVVFFSLNTIVKKAVEKIGPSVTKVDVKLGSAEISPFSGGGRLTKLFVGNPEGYKSPSAIEIGDIKVSAKLGSLMSDTLVVNEINIQDAVITLEGSLSGNNLTTLMNNINGASTNASQPKPKGEPPAPGTSQSSKKFIVKDLVLVGAKVNVNLTLPGLGNQSMTLPLPPLHLTDIGVAENGVTAEQLVQAIMKPLLSSVTTAATQQVGNLSGTLKNLTKGSSNTLDKATKSLKDLFNKK